MSASTIAGNPPALKSIAAALGEAARSLPLSCPAGASAGDPAADAALQEFTARWTAHLERLNRVAALTARHAHLTALAFQRAGG